MTTDRLKYDFDAEDCDENLQTESSDIKSLDMLLASALKMAAAKKAKAQNRLLDEDQKELIRLAEKMKDELIWIEQETIAHFIETNCQSCNHAELSFNNFYTVFSHKTTSSKKLILNKEFTDKDNAIFYSTVKKTQICIECFADKIVPTETLEKHLNLLKSLEEK